MQRHLIRRAIAALALTAVASAGADSLAAQSLTNVQATLRVPTPGTIPARSFFSINVGARNRTSVHTGQCVEVNLEYPLAYMSVSHVESPFRGNMCGDCAFGAGSTGKGKVTCAVRALGANEEMAFTVRMYVQRTGGTAVTATADPQNLIRESNEKDNIAVSPIVLGSW